MGQEELFDIEPSPVAPRLKRIVGGGMWTFLVDGKVAFTFPEDDKLNARVTAVLTLNNGWADKRQVAEQWGVSVRCVDLWLNKYADKGSAGLALDKGRQRMTTAAVVARIVEMKAQHHSVAGIADALKIPYGRARRILQNSKAERNAVPPPPLFEGSSLEAEALETATDSKLKINQFSSITHDSIIESVANEDIADYFNVMPCGKTDLEVPTTEIPADTAIADSSLPDVETHDQKHVANSVNTHVTPSAAAAPLVGNADMSMAGMPADTVSAIANCDDESTEHVANEVFDKDIDILYSPSSKVVDPLDRGFDRAMARMGMLDDAVPAFADCGHVERAGALLAVAVLASSGFLANALKIYKSFGAAFYGVRTTFMTLFVMAVARIRNPEQVNDLNPLTLGRLLGLDRSPSVKTLRSKIKVLCHRRQAANLMNVTAKERVGDIAIGDVTLLVDGHVHAYNGDAPVGKTFSTSRSRVVKGATDYWVNLPDGTPLLCIQTPFNSALNKMLPSIIIEARKICPGRRITVVFDRGGSDAATYEALIKLEVDILAYHRFPDPINHALFTKTPTIINGKECDHAPLEREIELKVYDKTRERKDTGRRVKLRELIVLRKDGKTTHAVTTRRDKDSATLLTMLFRRWTQENFFKHFDYAYDFDHLAVYAKTAVPKGGDHPNPEFTQLQKQARKLRSDIGRMLQRNIGTAECANPVALAARLSGGLPKAKAQTLADLCENLKKTQDVMAVTPRREGTDSFVQLDAESRLLLNLVKSEAYCAEGVLARLVGDEWSGVNGNEKGIVEGMMQTTGSIKVNGGLLQIALRHQSTPERTRLLRHLCDTATVMAVNYPGTTLRMVFSVEEERF